MILRGCKQTYRLIDCLIDDRHTQTEIAAYLQPAHAAICNNFDYACSAACAMRYAFECGNDRRPTAFMLAGCTIRSRGLV